MNYTIWSYVSDHDAEGLWGDFWNREDLSVFSRREQYSHWKDDINSGGRALPSVARPYAFAIAGIPTHMRFTVEHGVFHLTFDTGHSWVGSTNMTEIFLPMFQFPNGVFVDTSDGKYEIIRWDGTAVSAFMSMAA